MRLYYLIMFLHEHRSSTQKNNLELIEKFNNYIKNSLEVENPCCENICLRKSVYIIVLCNSFLKVHFKKNSKYCFRDTSLKSYYIRFNANNDMVIDRLAKIIKKRKAYRNVFVIYKICADNYFINLQLDDQFIVNNEEMILFRTKFKQKMADIGFYYDDIINYGRYDLSVSWVKTNYNRSYVQDLVYYHKIYDNNKFFKFEIELKKIDISDLVNEYFSDFFPAYRISKEEEINFIRKYILNYKFLTIQLESINESILRITECNSYNSTLIKNKCPVSYLNIFYGEDITLEEFVYIYNSFDDLTYFIVIFNLIKDTKYFEILMKNILNDVKSLRNKILIDILLDLNHITSGVYTFYDEIAEYIPFPILSNISEYITYDVLLKLRSNFMIKSHEYSSFKDLLTFFYIAISKKSKIDLKRIVKAVKAIFQDPRDFIVTRRKILLRLEILLHFTLSCNVDRRLEDDFKQFLYEVIHEPSLIELIDSERPLNIMSVNDLIRAYYIEFVEEVEDEYTFFERIIDIFRN